jgi:hypothetical protein
MYRHREPVCLCRISCFINDKTILAEAFILSFSLKNSTLMINSDKLSLINITLLLIKTANFYEHGKRALVTQGP